MAENARQEEILMQSEVVQYFKEQGIQQGARESIIEGILESLEFRFSAGGVEELKSVLESVETLQRLKELRRQALGADSLEMFRQMLLENEDQSGP